MKFDLLGLGMLSALHYAVDFVREHRGYEIDLAVLDHTDRRSTTCSAGPTRWGVPGRVARPDGHAAPARAPHLLRPRGGGGAHPPGPIQGGSVHPYIRRRKGQEPVTFPHPLLEGCLAKTLGIPLFQEQLMQMAIDIAGFTPGEADQLRQAMGSKRSRRADGAAAHPAVRGHGRAGVTGETAEDIWVKLVAFANYGFPESHSVSFAYLVFASSWIKRYEPAAFCAAAQRAADGLLLAALARAGRPPARGGGAQPRHQRIGRRRHPRTGARGA